jgi:hypothetical protein
VLELGPAGRRSTRVGIQLQRASATRGRRIHQVTRTTRNQQPGGRVAPRRGAWPIRPRRLPLGREFHRMVTVGDGLVRRTIAIPGDPATGFVVVGRTTIVLIAEAIVARGVAETLSNLATATRDGRAMALPEPGELNDIRLKPADAGDLCHPGRSKGRGPGTVPAAIPCSSLPATGDGSGAAGRAVTVCVRGRPTTLGRNIGTGRRRRAAGRYLLVWCFRTGIPGRSPPLAPTPGQTVRSLPRTSTRPVSLTA